MLLDEADVFLEQRSLADLQRNALVSGKPFPLSIINLEINSMSSLSTRPGILRRHISPY